MNKDIINVIMTISVSTTVKDVSCSAVISFTKIIRLIYNLNNLGHNTAENAIIDHSTLLYFYSSGIPFRYHNLVLNEILNWVI